MRPDFRQRWLVVRRGGEYVDSHPFYRSRDEFADQLATRRADERTAEDFTRLRIEKVRWGADELEFDSRLNQPIQENLACRL